MKILHKKRQKRIVAIDKEMEIGFIEYSYSDDFAGKRNIIIDYVFVDEDFRCKGIGTALLEYFLEEFRDKVWVSFWTGREIERNKGYGIYTKVGFEEVFYQADYYEKGIGSRLFVKKCRGK